MPALVEACKKDPTLLADLVPALQMCLSWEFLRWQYEQARDLPESNPYHSHQYNQAAGEFQQFQVVVQRFVEDESYKGPRLPNYINNRCVLRNLLQVPVVKEDSMKDRMDDQRKGNLCILTAHFSLTLCWRCIAMSSPACCSLTSSNLGHPSVYRGGVVQSSLGPTGRCWLYYPGPRHCWWSRITLLSMDECPWCHCHWNCLK